MVIHIIKHKIFQAHFAPDMWEKVRVDGKRKLKHNAVPTIFPFLYNTEAIFHTIEKIQASFFVLLQ